MAIEIIETVDEDLTTSGILKQNTSFVTFVGSRALASEFANKVSEVYQAITGKEPKTPIRVGVLPTIFGNAKIRVPDFDSYVFDAVEKALEGMPDKMKQKIKADTVVFDNGA